MSRVEPIGFATNLWRLFFTKTYQSFFDAFLMRFWCVFDTVWCVWYGFVVFSIQTKILSLHFCQLKRFWYVFDTVWCFWYVFVTSIEHIWDGFETLLCWFLVNRTKPYQIRIKIRYKTVSKCPVWRQFILIRICDVNSQQKRIKVLLMRFDAFLIRFWYCVMRLIRICGVFDTN